MFTRWSVQPYGTANRPQGLGRRARVDEQVLHVNITMHLVPQAHKSTEKQEKIKGDTCPAHFVLERVIFDPHFS
jgi:hypothetical protein